MRYRALISNSGLLVKQKQSEILQQMKANWCLNNYVSVGKKLKDLIERLLTPEG